ncbi:MAG: hypothetical protein J6X84_00895 [Treponema sp.]|nr:hypothetical protein [Treponema sp.]
MGLLSRARVLDNNPGLAFSDFVLKNSLKTCAVLELKDNNYFIAQSIGFDAFTISSSISTSDFWNGVCAENKKIYYFDEQNAIFPFLQLFSEAFKEDLSELSVYKNSKNQIFICKGKLSEQAAADFENLNDKTHQIDFEKLNQNIKSGSFVLKFEIDFCEAVESFLETEIAGQRQFFPEIKNAIFMELYNKFACNFNFVDATKYVLNGKIKTILIADKNYSVELITNHFILNLREVLANFAELINFEFLGTSESGAETQDFLKAD